MELLIVLGILGGFFALGLIVLGFAELAVYLVAGIKAFPVKVENVYNSLVEDNKELLEKIKARKQAKAEKRAKAKEEKRIKKEQEIINEVKEETEKVEENLKKDEVENEKSNEIINDILNK